jgi:biotin carboxylase
MVVGAGEEQLPVIKEIKEMGLDVVAVDRNPDAPGLKYATFPYMIDTIDEKRCIDVAKKHKVSGVVPAPLGYSVRTIGALNEELGLIGIKREAAIYATDKHLMRQRMKDVGVSDLKFGVVKTYKEAERLAISVGYPLILKPVDGSGSRGVEKVNAKEGLRDAFFSSSKSFRNRKDLVIEEFIDGQELGVDGFVVDGKVNILTIRNKVITEEPYRQELEYYYPSNITSQEVFELNKFINRVAKTLSIDETPFMVDIKQKPNRAFELIEINARLAGYAIASEFVPAVTGISPISNSIKLVLSEDLELAPKKTRAGVMRFFNFKPGIIKSIRGVSKAKDIDGVKVLRLNVKKGDTIPRITCGSDAMDIGYYIVTGDSLREAKETADRLDKEIKVSVTG